MSESKSSLNFIYTDIELFTNLYTFIDTSLLFLHSLEELMMRFEEPNSNQRWDSPLFVMHPEDELPYDQISNALFNRKPPPPNMATQNVIWLLNYQ